VPGSEMAMNMSFIDASGFSGMNTMAAPLAVVGTRAYVLLPEALVNLGAAVALQTSAEVLKNQIDGRFGSRTPVLITTALFCGFSDNHVQSNGDIDLVRLSADHVAANQNRLIAPRDTNCMTINARRYVVMGNMSTGDISVNQSGNLVPLPTPWKDLNIRL